jgi:hypothetical protein
MQRFVFSCREFDDASLDGSLENVERGSLASFGSGTTTDSDNHNKVMEMTDKYFYIFWEIKVHLQFCPGKKV